MEEQEDPLISVHDVLGFLSDSDSLSDSPCCPIRFPTDNCRLFPIDVIFCVHMVRQSVIVNLFYYSLQLQLQRLLVESSQFKKGDSCC